MSNRIKYTALLLILALGACRDEEEGSSIVDTDVILGLASPIQCDIDGAVIQVSDYILDPDVVDSVTMFGEALEFSGRVIHIHDWNSEAALVPMKLWSQGEAFSIPVKRSKKQRLEFTFDPQGKEYADVRMKGEMTSWNPDQVDFELKDGVYRTELILEPGVYQYIILLNGIETLDSNNPESVDNGIGGRNSLLTFGEKDENALVLRASFSEERIQFNANEDADLLVLWDDQEMEIERVQDNYFIRIPSHSKEFDRSFIRAWAYDENRISNDLLIPLERGAIVTSTDQLSRADKHAQTLYNVFVDRFHNGDQSNDRPVDTGEVLPKANDLGGDIRGAIQKLEEGYFQDLGINTIWISPIVKNVEGAFGAWPDPVTKFSAYHGYWPISFTLIDDRKGTEQDLHELVSTAHAKGMNVLLDFVANHIHEDHPYYQADKSVATELYLPDGSLNTERWDDHRLTTWFDIFLPTLRLYDPAVYEMLTDSAVFWIEEYDLDGFRHDATKHVPEVFWRTLTQKLKERVISKGKDIYQIGETYGTAELISSYVNSGQLDAQFDFNVYDAIVASLCRNDVSFERLDNEIHSSLDVYGHHHLMGNITGNQDRGRFISYAGGALKFDENAKVAGWTRDIGVGDHVGYERSKQLMAIISTIPGLPVIYYGDEIGSYGGNDPDNRKMMRFEELTDDEKSIKDVTMQMLALHNNSLALIYGDFRTHLVELDRYVYSRNYLGESVFVVINNSDQERLISFRPEDDQSAIIKESISGKKVERIENNMLMVSVGPNSFEILRTK